MLLELIAGLWVFLLSAVSFGQDADFKSSVEAARSEYSRLHQAQTQESYATAFGRSLDRVMEALEFDEDLEGEGSVFVDFMMVILNLSGEDLSLWLSRTEDARVLDEWMVSQLSEWEHESIVDAYFVWVQWQFAQGWSERAEETLQEGLERTDEAIDLLLLGARMRRALSDLIGAWDFLEWAQSKMEDEGVEEDSSAFLDCRRTLADIDIIFGRVEPAERALKSILDLYESTNEKLRSATGSREEAKEAMNTLEVIRVAGLSYIDVQLLSSKPTRALDALADFRERWEGRALEDHNFLVREALVYEFQALLEPESRPLLRERIREIGQRFSPSSPYSWQISMRLGRLALMEGDLESAQAWFDEAEDRLATISLSAHERTQEETFLLAQRGFWAIANSGNSDTDQVFQALSSGYHSLVTSWRQQAPLMAGGLGFLEHGTRRGIVSAAILTAGRAEGPEASLREYLWAEQAGTLARRHDLPLPRLNRIQATLLGENSGVLIYLMASEKSILLMIDKEGVKDPIVLPDLAQTERLRGELMQMTRSPDQYDDQRWLKLSTAYRERLLPASALKTLDSWNHVFVAGDPRILGALGRCSYDDGTPLDVRHAVSYLPSLTYGSWLADREASDPSPEIEADLSMVVGQGDFGDSIYRFHFSEPDEAQLLAPFERSEVIRRAEDVVSAETGEIDLSLYRVAHFLAHGDFAYERERISGLRLDNDHALWATDFEKGKLPNTVILSVCGAARGHSRFGEDGISHIGGATLEGGASAVILSQEDLYYKPQILLMSEVHRHLVAGNSPAEALQKAKRVVYEDEEFGLGPWLSHQFVFGLGHRPVEGLSQPQVALEERGEGQTLNEGPPKTSWKPVIGGLGLIVIGIGILLMRRR